jgi:hypothetical protein
MRTIARALSISMFLVPALAGTAYAQPDAENRATARELAGQGQQALDAKDFAKAEDLFRRADALFHAPTLLLGLARAQAAEGKFVESWEAYNRIIIEGVTSTPVFAKALDDAKKEITAIEGRRSRVTIGVTGPTSPNVSMDNSPLKNEALGVAFFINPGTHNVQVSADGFNPATRTFAVAEGQTETVSIALEAAAVAAPTPPPPVTAPPPAGGDTAHHGVSHVPAIIAFGVGGAGLVAGALTGIVAMGDHNQLKNACPNGKCGADEQSKLQSYHTMGLISTVGFIAAGVGVAVGTTLWIVESKKPSPTSASVAPYIGFGSVGAVGTF